MNQIPASYYSQIFSYTGLNIPATVGYCKRTKYTAIFINHLHPDTEIWYCCDGKAEITVSAKVYTLNSGDAVIINPNEIHSGKMLSSYVSYICVQFSPFFFAPNENENTLPYFKHLISNDLNIVDIFNRLQTECVYNQEYSQTAKTGLLYELTAYIMRNFLQTRSSYEKLISSKALSKLVKATDFISENANKKIKIKDVADAVNLSESRICHLFKKEMGRTVGEYITEVKLYNALILLETTKHSVSQIADMTGFNNLNYFIKVFKNYYKVTPNTIRKRLF